MKNNILVLGATGMLGHTVYSYLCLKFPNAIFGTTRNNSEFFLLNVDSFEIDFKLIYKKIGKIDYVINCIGILNISKDKKEAEKVNAIFPQKISKYAEKFNFRLIHVSTDAVFNSQCGKVDENVTPDPDSFYGKTKLNGEPKNKHAISIRTSFLGFDWIKHKGLLEWALNSENDIAGYTNQAWSGCTTLQFAKLCEFLIKGDNFDTFRKKSTVLHFSPLGPTKYELLSKFINLLNKNIQVIKSKSNTPIKRLLTSVYFDNEFIKNYTTDLGKALSDLIKFERLEKNEK